MDHPETLVFDLDGTLIHSAPDLQLAANEALKRIDRAGLDLPTIISFIGNGADVLAQRVLEATGGADEALSRDFLAHLLEIYGQNATTHTRPYPGVVQSLEAFRAKGLRLGICTNKPTAPARDICDTLDLTRFFDVIIGAKPDQPKKPEPHALLHSIDMLGGRVESALYVGDSGVDYHTALNANVAFRLFNGGYLNDPLPDLHPSRRFDSWSDHGIGIG